MAVLVAALGYFVDIYDLILFSIVRVASLKDLGVPAERLLDEGVLLLNMQMGGMLVGGVLWGILGDKRGRLSVLFGSIVMYSLANIVNGLVASVPQYAVCRFIAGIGLAGELGAGITLVSESMSRESRGYGTTLIATIGILGAVVGALIGDAFPWRTSYFIGGGMGLLLLALRVSVYESSMFSKVKQQATATRGNFLMLLSSWPRAKRYLSVIIIGIPIWYAVGILITFSPEFGKAFGMSEIPKAGTAVLWCYSGLALGDFGSGMLSQLLKTRKQVVVLFLLMTSISIALYFTAASASLAAFYAVCGVLGFSTGYWAVFVTVASEHFGTNLRATATTSAPNFVRGSVVLLTLSFQALKPALGIEGSALAVGTVVLIAALLATRELEETYGKDLDFIE